MTPNSEDRLQCLLCNRALRHLGQDAAARRIETAVHQAYREAKHLTHDVGGNASTEEFTAAVVGGLE